MLLIVTLSLFAMLAQSNLIVPVPEFVISCPGKKQTGATTTTCEDSPMRAQALVSVVALKDSGLATDCAAPVYDAVDAGNTNCNGDGFDCYDSRDCCSSFCDWSVTPNGGKNGWCAPPATTGAQGGKSGGAGSAYQPGQATTQAPHNTATTPTPHNTEPPPEQTTTSAPRNTEPPSGSAPPPNNHRSLRHTGADSGADTGDDERICSSNSECLSFRCLEGHCDEEIGATYAGIGTGCDPTNLAILYTVELEGEQSPGDPSPSNSQNTLRTRLGDWQEMSFPGKVTVRARTEHCFFDSSTSTTNCTLSATSKMTVVVGSDGPRNDAKDINDDAKPTKGTNDTYIRSAVVFDEFDGGAALFNATRFKHAVSEALNTDRMVYVPGKDKGVEAFALVKVKDVQVILVDPKKKVVQFEVRTKRRDDGIEISARLLHSYFKYPLALYLAKWEILDQATFEGTFEQAQRIQVDSKNSVVLVADDDGMANMIVVMLPEIVAVIVLSALLVVFGLVYVIFRSRAQFKIEVLQSKRAYELDSKEEELARREEELSGMIRALEKQKNTLLNDRKNLEKVAKRREEEYQKEHDKFKEMAVEEVRRIYYFTLLNDVSLVKCDVQYVLTVLRN
jgi:hypothetical protein